MMDTTPKIIIIPPKQEDAQAEAAKKHLRVAAYCRVSTDDEEQLTSYEAQRTYYTEKITQNPEWTMASVFADEGITGTSVKSRKEFQKMIRQCRQGRIDLILTKSLSRFSRNTLDVIKYTRELRNLGVSVIFEKENINSIYVRLSKTIPEILHHQGTHAVYRPLCGAQGNTANSRTSLGSVRPAGPFLWIWLQQTMVTGRNQYSG